MSDGFPSRSCADATLSHGGVVEAADRFQAFFLVFGRGHTIVRISDSDDSGARGLVDNDEGGAVDCCART